MVVVVVVVVVTPLSGSTCLLVFWLLPLLPDYAMMILILIKMILSPPLSPKLLTHQMVNHFIYLSVWANKKV